jgi:hypothetical protein
VGDTGERRSPAREIAAGAAAGSASFGGKLDGVARYAGERGVYVGETGGEAG